MGGGAHKDRKDKDRDRRDKDKDDRDKDRRRRRDRDRGRSRERRREAEGEVSTETAKPRLVAAVAVADTEDTFEEITEEEAETDDEETSVAAPSPEEKTAGKNESKAANLATAKARDKSERPKDRTDRRSRSRDHGPKRVNDEKMTGSKEHKSKDDARHERADLRKPAHPEGTPSKTVTAKESDSDNKDSVSYCELCCRSIGGGMAGWWQHRRSPQHLAAYLYWREHNEKLPWKQCLQEGKRWSQRLLAKKRNRTACRGRSSSGKKGTEEGSSPASSSRGRGPR